jgi:hypothetical protein
MNTTLAKAYAAIIAIPVAALMLAGAIGGSDSYDYDDYEADLAQLDQREAAPAGAQVSEAEAYSSLGKYNPCIFIQCEGE